MSVTAALGTNCFGRLARICRDFSSQGPVARLVHDTDRSVSHRCSREETPISQVVAKTTLPDVSPPSTRRDLMKLIAKGKANPKVIKTLKCKTIAEGRFRHLNFIRNLPAYVVDEPPGLLGDDTAPNPSEASLAALGSCLAVGIHANAVAQGITVYKLEIGLEGDLNITGGLGHRRPFGKAGRLHRCARQGDLRGRPFARRARRVGRAREEVVSGRQHLHAPGQSRGQAHLIRDTGGRNRPSAFNRASANGSIHARDASAR